MGRAGGLPGLLYSVSPGGGAAAALFVARRRFCMAGGNNRQKMNDVICEEIIASWFKSVKLIRGHYL